MAFIITAKRTHEIYRNASTTNLDERKELEFWYIVLEVQTKIFRRWATVVIFPALVNFGCGSILCIYIPIKYTEVPAIFNFCFLFVGAVILGVIYWLSYDIVLVIRGTEELLGRLRTFHRRATEHRARDLTQLRFLKRSQACRPLEIPVGTFGEFSLDVPVIMGDEILNQLLFLLSL